MRRKDREITDMREIYEIIKKCDVCHVAFYNEEYPYVIPLNFGVTFNDGRFKLYFHCAKEGTKLELMKKNPHVAFAMDCSHNLVFRDDSSCTMEYESVCGNGVLHALPEQEKVGALSVLMQQYHGGEEYTFPEQVVKMVEVLELTIDNISGKRLKKNWENKENK